MTGPLNGLKIIDITTIVMGPFATQLMAKMVADVIKIEAPGGDTLRGIGPARNPDMGWMFIQTNRGKRSVMLDLKTPEGRASLIELASTADVVVSNMRPAALRRLGLTYETFSQSNPRIIFATLCGYDERGPMAGKPAFDDLIQGGSGIPHLYKEAGGAVPRYAPITLSDRVVGLYGLSSILAALYSREQTGRGQAVEVAMFETMAHFVLGDHIGGALFEPALGPTGYPRLLSEQRRPYPTKDGYVCTMIYNNDQWRRFLTAIGEPELFETDPRFASVASRTRHVDEINQIIADRMAERTTDECIALLEAADLPVARLNTIESLLDSPQLAASGLIQHLEHPTEGAIRVAGAPMRFSQTPIGPIRPAPLLGEHNAELLGEPQKQAKKGGAGKH